MRFVVALVALWSFTQSAQALEVWLASSPDTCNSCAIYRQVAQQRGYGRALRYADGAGLTIPILSIFKGVLASDVVAQLPAELGPKSATWDTTLLVLVVEAGRVLAAGNISDSADLSELRRARAVMFPPAEPAADDPALHDDDFYTEFFASHWNLEYFVDVALGKRPARSPSRPVDLASPMPAELGASNVILWGSAGIPAANSLFIPTRIGEIRADLERMRLGSVRYVTLFGHGPGVQGNDTSYSEGGRTLFKRSDLRADYAADAPGLNAVLTAQRHAERARTLLVQVGHSGPAGSPLWGHGLTLVPADLEPIERESSGQLVMVSGACNGGRFAKAVQCGFFAAHPDVTASGCQLSPAALEKSDDYLRHFFGALSGGTRGAPTAAGRRRGAPPPVTFYDAHWYASTRLEDHQLSYTTTDALIDDYFAAHPDKLPPTMTVAEIQLAARNLAGSEAKAVADLTAGLLPETAIPLTGYVEANHEAQAKLADARELSSAERNRIVALPYKLELALLARRIAYGALHVGDAAYALAASCERRTLQQFFSGAR